ncbi:DoxX family membrane protein [Chitinophaga sp. sic0106]|uniref:DoxX family protein n=1 Tax=Chitinophaga sp. sic0106 TaxID=2854785 RepID=UPI001C45F133|nr:DoxX family membrane protein [Chitinophaga sp. sic0106]MBV7529728.1 DoxX family membrane protein [Chitinophaga sp. sic0106]
MKPLIVLIVTFLLALVALHFFHGGYEWAFAGRIAMAVMLFFTASAHFAFTRGMEMMMPPGIPFKKGLVYLTGILEILGGIGLLISGWMHLTGICLIVFFLAVLPANIYAALKQVDYQKGTHQGNGISYLWFRIPLQVLFILWVYFSAVAV